MSKDESIKPIWYICAGFDSSGCPHTAHFVERVQALWEYMFSEVPAKA